MRKATIKTNWIVTDVCEPFRVIYTAKVIRNGFFRLNKFHVLPYEEYGAKFKNSQFCVLFPRIDISKFPRFWDRVRKVNVDVADMSCDDSRLLTFIKRELDKYNFPKKDYSQKIKMWDKIGDQVLDAVFKATNINKSEIKEINVYVSRFGPGGSFSIYKGEPTKINLLMREGAQIGNLVSCLVSGLTRYNLQDEMNSTWKESTVVVDWLLKYSQIADVLNKYNINKKVGTVESLRSRQNQKYEQISERFYAEFGLPSKSFDISANDKDVFVGDRKITGLSKRELSLLKLFVRNKGNLVSTDKISDVLFNGSVDNFSLYSISKSIQRLRDKLEKNGISAGYIETVRGRGYVLNC